MDNVWEPFGHHLGGGNLSSGHTGGFGELPGPPILAGNQNMAPCFGFARRRGPNDYPKKGSMTPKSFHRRNSGGLDRPFELTQTAHSDQKSMDGSPSSANYVLRPSWLLLGGRQAPQFWEEYIINPVFACGPDSQGISGTIATVHVLWP